MASATSGGASLVARKPYKFEVVPLTEANRTGLMAIGCIAFVSSLFAFALVAFMTWRMMRLRYKDGKPVRNQVVILIYNVMIASFIQSMSLIFSFDWLRQGHVPGPTTTCFAQGWLLHIGNLAAGLFVMCISIHTLVNKVIKKDCPECVFLLVVLGLWLSAFLIASVGAMVKGNGFFVRVGVAWVSLTVLLSLHHPSFSLPIRQDKVKANPFSSAASLRNFQWRRLCTTLFFSSSLSAPSLATVSSRPN